MNAFHSDKPPTSIFRRQLKWRLSMAALASGIAYLALGVVIFVLPQGDPIPASADVAVVLGFPERPRLELADDLLRRGVVGSVLISAPPSRTDPTVPDAYWARLCAKTPRTICRVARPWTTQGEARMLRTLAAQRGWSSAVVITQTAHLTRARLLFSRCFTGTLTMRPSGEAPEQGWAFQFAYQTAAGFKALSDGHSC